MFAQGMFTIDPNATPDQIARKRAAIMALMPRYGQARSVGEGIGQLATGIMAGRQGRKLDAAESTGTQQATDLFTRLLGRVGTQPVSQGSGQASVPYQAPVADPNSSFQLGRDAMAAIGKPANNGLSAPVQLGMDAMAALGKPNNLTPQQMVIAGATQRGLDPLDVATAMSYETGGTLDPLQRGPTTQWGQHEGLIQFGDPQGVQHGAVFDQGPDVAMRSQLDPQNGAVWSYLDETGVQPGMGLDNIYSAINAGAPGRFNASDANNGGAPGTVADKVAGMGDHREKAMAWLGMEGQPAQGGVTMSTQGQPQPTQAQGGPGLEELYSALGNPWLNDQQRAVIGSMIEQQTQSADPMRQIELQRAQLELAQMQGGPVLPRPVTPEERAMYGLPEGVPYGIVPGELPKPLTGSGVTVNNVPPGQPTIGTVPQGYAVVQVPVTPENPSGYTMAPIPGGPEDVSVKNAAADSNNAAASEVVINSAARAREADKQRVVGGVFGQIAALNPTSQNAEIVRQVEALKANASAENIAAMRAASPTGAALGGVSDKDIALLAAKSGVLDPASPKFARDLDDYERTILRLVHGQQEGDRIFDATRDGAPQPVASVTVGQPDDLTPAEKAALGIP